MEAASAHDEIVRPEQRMDTRRAAAEAHAAMAALDAAVTLEPALRELVRLRASLVNGCAYCIQLHTRDALAAGETQERLFALGAWEESPYFTSRERAALRFTDAVTDIRDGHMPDEAWDEAAAHFDEPELAQLLFAAVAINAWNRLAISTRKPPPPSRGSG
jgi:AhpD family alkylhydroperoxidase